MKQASSTLILPVNATMPGTYLTGKKVIIPVRYHSEALGGKINRSSQDGEVPGFTIQLPAT